MRRDRWLVPLAFLAFVSLGLPDGVLGVAWPSLRRSFDRPVEQLGRDPARDDGGLPRLELQRRRDPGADRRGPAARWRAACSSRRAPRSGPRRPAWPPVLLGGVLSGLGAGAIDAGINAFAAGALHAAGDHVAARVLGPRRDGWPARHDRDARVRPRLALGLRGACRGARRALALLPPHARAVGFARARGRRRSARGRRTSSPPRGARGPPRAPQRAPLLRLHGHRDERRPVGLHAAHRVARRCRRPPPASPPRATGAASSWGGSAFGALAHHVAPATLLRLSHGRPRPSPRSSSRPRAPRRSAFAGLFALGLLLAPIFPLLISETPLAGRATRLASHAIGFQISAATLGAGTLPASSGSPGPPRRARIARPVPAGGFPPPGRPPRARRGCR